MRPPRGLTWFTEHYYQWRQAHNAKHMMQLVQVSIDSASTIVPQCNTSINISIMACACMQGAHQLFIMLCLYVLCVVCYV